MKSIEIAEIIAKQLHEDFRAACKAMKVPAGPHAHDHGYIDCGNKKKIYFRRRAALLVQRATNDEPQTLGEAEQAFQARVVLARRRVGGTPFN